MRDPDPQILGASEGVAVWGGVVGELAGALELLSGFLAGRQPPGGSGAPPRLSGRLVALQQACATAARDQQAARHRELAMVSQAKPQTTAVFISPENLDASSETANLTVAEAAEALGVSVQYARALCRSGKLRAVRGPRSTWTVYASSVSSALASHRTRRQRSGTHGSAATADD